MMQRKPRSTFVDCSAHIFGVGDPARVCLRVISAVGHEGRFPALRLNDRCRSRKRSLAVDGSAAGCAKARAERRFAPLHSIMAIRPSGSTKATSGTPAPSRSSERAIFDHHGGTLAPTTASISGSTGTIADSVATSFGAIART